MEDTKESKDVLELANSLDVFMYLANEDVDEDAVVVENAQGGLALSWSWSYVSSYRRSCGT